MLAAMADAGTLSKGKCNTLSHLSITRIQSSRWQMEAKLDEDVFSKPPITMRGAGQKSHRPDSDLRIRRVWSGRANRFSGAGVGRV
jgi:hypothetical protein